MYIRPTQDYPLLIAVVFLSPKLWSPNKPVNTQTLNEYDDLQWFAIPRHFVEGFNINDNITLSIVKSGKKNINNSPVFKIRNNKVELYSGQQVCK